MQNFNKKATINTFSHTWYVYPLSIALIAGLWIWSYHAYHLPSAHQKINVFFASDVRNDSFLKSIMNKHYDKEKLREVSTSYSLPTGTLYYQKLQIALVESDILILDENTLSGFANKYQEQLVEITTDIKDTYLTSDHEYYQFNSKDYGIIIKEKNVICYLNEYMTFDENQNYYLLLNQSSTNLGKIKGDDNAYYDNALTYMDYLLEGNI